MNDPISKQAAIAYAISGLTREFEGEKWIRVSEVRESLKTLPSTQPEIIRCKDCMWYGRVDKRRFYRGMDCLQKRIDTIVPDRDFCSRAERRTEWMT